jgi:hypothetical protein
MDAVATIGRWAPWLPQVCAGRAVWLASMRYHPGELEAAHYCDRLHDAKVQRLLPPPHCKDWNTALVKQGRAGVSRWLRDASPMDITRQLPHRTDTPLKHPDGEIYVSTDVEVDGPIPGPHSMLSFASAAYRADKTLVGTFTANLELLPARAATPTPWPWWEKNREAWDASRTGLRAPQEAMNE